MENVCRNMFDLKSMSANFVENMIIAMISETIQMTNLDSA